MRAAASFQGLIGIGITIAALVLYERVTGRDARDLPSTAMVDGVRLAATLFLPAMIRLRGQIRPLDDELVDDLRPLSLDRPQGDAEPVVQTWRDPAVHVRVDGRIAAPHAPHHLSAAGARNDAVPRQRTQRVDVRLAGGDRTGADPPP